MLEKNYRDGDFVYAHRRFADPKDKLHLSTEEFYLYATLYTKRMKDDSIIVNISLIEEFLHVPFNNRASRNKSAIRDTLIRLIRKGVYKIHDFPELEGLSEKSEEEIPDLVKRVGYTEQLKLTINHEYIKSELGGREWKGFVRIPYTEIRKFSKMRSLYIYFSTLVKENAEGMAAISYQEWANILGLSYKTAVSHVNKTIVNSKEYNDDGVIYVRKGGFLDDSRKRQEMNVYSTLPLSGNDKPKIRRIGEKSETPITTEGDGLEDNINDNPF